VADFRGEAAEAEFAEVRVELPVDANLPVEYLPGERLRLEAYRALANATTDAAVDAVAEELVDRFGPLPEPVSNLVAVARFRVLCRANGVTEVSLQGNSIRFSPMTLPESAQLRLNRLFDKPLYKPGVAVVSVARPKSGAAKFGGEPLRDSELLTWCAELITTLLA
jgi:transcription-repair coupling factor (superfamily II helicase)